MNNTEFEAVRRLLFFSQRELAEVLQVRENSVKRWCRGTHPVPEGVAETLRRLCAWRDTAYNELADAIEAHDGVVALTWYNDMDDWLMDEDDPACFRPYQSALAELYATFEQVRLVAFDRMAYQDWLRDLGYKDNRQFRSQWAALQIK